MTNEEKILSLLEQQGQTLERQGKTLERQGKLLEQHSAMLQNLTDDVSDLKTRVASVELAQENIILPSLQALAEGQKTILETLAPKNRVEALEDEMVFMKSVIKSLSQEVAELKRAQ